jgi:hypothetical protein
MNSSPQTAEHPRTDEGPHSRKRRLSDKILVVFHLACDQQDLEVAFDLLRVLEFIAGRRPIFPTGRERRAQDILVAAHERLWEVRHFALNRR